jgi:hypothetical protein
MITIIYENTPLSNPICSIVNKYVDNSFEIICSIFVKKVNYKANKIKDDITLIDIFVMSVNGGYSGFWILKIHDHIIGKIKKMITKENLNNYIMTEESELTTRFYIKKLKDINITSCPIYKLKCWINISNVIC